jgi:hypothetical protein
MDITLTAAGIREISSLIAELAGSLALVGEISPFKDTRNLNKLHVWWVPMGATAFSLLLVVNAIFTSLS